VKRPLQADRGFIARLLVWAVLSAALLGYIRWGSELTAVTSFFFIRRSVPEIWNSFHEGLPEIGNARALEAVYWTSIAALIVGVLALMWLALAPEPTEPDAEATDS
jgi:hypothetical protein